jgi:hypothetical protein
VDAWIIPGWWEFTLLAFAGYRLTRFVGWDEWPPIARLRAWAIGERWVPADGELELPGKQPTSEAHGVRPAYDRPVVAHLVHCPFCLGWWISLALYAGWLAAPRGILYAMTPFALSGVVGLIAKNLDP